jgi:micrococcal nuclease
MKNNITSLIVITMTILGFFGIYFVATLVDVPEDITEDVSGEGIRVLSVIDGDTFKIEDNVRVRLIGIDTPERGDCYYDEATEELRNLIEGKVVKLDKDISDTDRYDRLLRYVVIEREGEDNLFVNDHMIRNGFAFDISSAPDNRYRDMFSSASEIAKRERLGLWNVCEYEEVVKLGETDSGPTDPDCIIKGNISEKGYGKTYLIPNCDNYNTVKIDTKKGESYFCTEEEAEDAGFRKATNCP